MSCKGKRNLEHLQEPVSKKFKSTKHENKTFQVFCRFRPPSSEQKQNYYHEKGTNILELQNPPNFKGKIPSKQFTFDYIFKIEDNQQEVYNRTAHQFVQNFLESYSSGLIFCYGVTNAGKTFTMMGTKQNQGIVYRTLEMIFSKINCTFGLNFFEIYNDSIFDLLSQKREPLQVFTSSSGETVIQNLTEKKISSKQESHDLIDYGLSQRKTAETSLNQLSSRSHTILQLNFNNQTLAIVDLAGAERSYRTNLQNKDRQSEANHINKSLTNLKRCIESIKCGAGHIPYRDCKLTRIFQQIFEQQSRINMIVNINPTVEDFEENINVLKFSAIAVKTDFNSNLGMHRSVDPNRNQEQRLRLLEQKIEYLVVEKETFRQNLQNAQQYIQVENIKKFQICPQANQEYSQVLNELNNIIQKNVHQEKILCELKAELKLLENEFQIQKEQNQF